MYQNHTKDTNNNCNKSLLSDFKDKLIKAIKRIKHEVDECREAERETYVESVEIEGRFDGLEREIRAEFQNLHRFLDEEEYKDLERLRRERQKQVKQLKEREKKIAEQGKNLERAITVLNGKLAEEDSPKLLKVGILSSIIQSSPLPILSEQVSGQLRPSTRGGHRGALWPVCGAHPVQNMEAHEELSLPKYYINDL